MTVTPAYEKNCLIERAEKSQHDNRATKQNNERGVPRVRNAELGLYDEQRSKNHDSYFLGHGAIISQRLNYDDKFSALFFGSVSKVFEHQLR